MGKLNGKIAVVTGASKGIGAEIARELAAQGASVVVNYASSREGAEAVVDSIRSAGGKAIAVRGNVGNESDVDLLFSATKETYGKVDILVNNAGVYTFAPIEDVTAESIAQMYNVNVGGTLLAAKAAVKLFPAEGGAIINIGSVAAELAPPMSSVYSGTKGAVNSITRALANELGPRHIRVNAVNPGPVRTEGYESAGFADSAFESNAVQTTPLGRVGQPADVATIVAFLASDDARWVTGSLIDAAGGLR